ncbi:hypothetical protein [Limnofasciculus baicalensis]|uniref:Uncharacterized protein n=1 Tax=Limnofasciculus baicalensis BBK-W-15 TaxID=2699891 RepID=A0AAE3GPP4_9CYAN|nr:hypothetical protein [Limnofasciculus baicalensis]MCP2727628.1 hypothetical protein [Limnofasciculus baicalensis BBK-W-15]
MNNSNITSLGFGISIVVILAGGLIYGNFNNQLNSTKAELQEIKKERENLISQVKEKDEEIENLKNTIGGNKREIEEQIEEIQQWKQQTRTVANCLEGVVAAISYASNENQAGALLALAGVQEKCQEAETIMNETKNTNSRRQSVETGN